MKMGVAQTRPATGNVAANIVAHKKLVGLALTNHADVLIFPEHSLTGYEPTLAKALAMDLTDPRLDDFREMSDSGSLVIGVGAPVRSNGGVTIGMIIFQPRHQIQVYSKRYLHEDEKEFFTSAHHSPNLVVAKTKIGLAICYELSVPQHAEDVFKSGADFYVASVAKSHEGIEQATKRMTWIAANYSMNALLCNCLGPCDNFESAGRSAVWKSDGHLLAQLNGTNEGILIYDTEKEKVFVKQF
jgi:predicted amidohydrolase